MGPETEEKWRPRDGIVLGMEFGTSGGARQPPRAPPKKLTLRSS